MVSFSIVESKYGWEMKGYNSDNNFNLPYKGGIKLPNLFSNLTIKDLTSCLVAENGDFFFLTSSASQSVLIYDSNLKSKTNF